MKTELVISFTLEGTHYWPNAPKQYGEFGHVHRHLFKFICWYPETPQSNIDRPIELWELRQNTILWVTSHWNSRLGVTDFGPMSVEGIAATIKEFSLFTRVFVGEEDFLGALISE